MVKVPEPDYYTLAEVAQKWEVSEDVLQRLIEEGKLQSAVRGPVTVHFFRDRGDGVLSPIPQEEIRAIVPKGTALYPARADKEAAYDSAYACATLCALDLTDERDGEGQKIMSRFIHPTYFLDADEDWIPAEPLRDDVLLVPSGDTQFSVDEVVIPTTEIHRIERQHEAAEKAIADDVLCGSAINSRRILLTVINALCEKAGINPRGRGATTKITQLLELQGTRAAERTIRDAIKEIPEAMQARKTANGK